MRTSDIGQSLSSPGSRGKTGLEPVGDQLRHAGAGGDQDGLSIEREASPLLGASCPRRPRGHGRRSGLHWRRRPPPASRAGPLGRPSRSTGPPSASPADRAPGRPAPAAPMSASAAGWMSANAGPCPGAGSRPGAGASSRRQPVRTRQTAGTRTATRRDTSRWCLMRATSPAATGAAGATRRRRQPPARQCRHDARHDRAQRHDGQELPLRLRRVGVGQQAARLPRRARGPRRSRGGPGALCGRSWRTTHEPARAATPTSPPTSAVPIGPRRRRRRHEHGRQDPGAPRRAVRSCPPARTCRTARRHQDQDQHRSGTDRQRRAVVGPRREGQLDRPGRAGRARCTPAATRRRRPARAPPRPGAPSSRGWCSPGSPAGCPRCGPRPAPCGARRPSGVSGTATRSPRSVSPGEPTRRRVTESMPQVALLRPRIRCSPAGTSDGRERCRRIPGPAGAGTPGDPWSSAPRSASPCRRHAPRGRLACRTRGGEDLGVRIGHGLGPPTSSSLTPTPSRCSQRVYGSTDSGLLGQHERDREAVRGAPGRTGGAVLGEPQVRGSPPVSIYDRGRRRGVQPGSRDHPQRVHRAGLGEGERQRRAAGRPRAASHVVAGSPSTAAAALAARIRDRLAARRHRHAAARRGEQGVERPARVAPRPVAKTS